MTNVVKFRTAEQAGTEPASQKPIAPAIIPFRLALQSLDEQIAEAVRFYWDAKLSSNEEHGKRYEKLLKGLRQSRKRLWDAIKEKESSDKARRRRS